MNLSDIITKCYILALIIRDDGERLLLGDGIFEFKSNLQHFAPNIYQNDIVELQGTDGQLLAGQVRRSATQAFDGYIADGTISKTDTEQSRRRFLAFFRTKHHYKVVYIMPDGTAIQRNRGYIVDAPAVQEQRRRRNLCAHPDHRNHARTPGRPRLGRPRRGERRHRLERIHHEEHDQRLRSNHRRNRDCSPFSHSSLRQRRAKDNLWQKPSRPCSNHARQNRILQRRNCRDGQ